MTPYLSALRHIFRHIFHASNSVIIHDPVTIHVVSLYYI